MVLSFEEGASAFYDLGEGPISYLGPVEIGLVGSSSGAVTIRCWSVDRAGNEAEVIESTVLMDLSEPGADLTLEPEAPGGENGYYLVGPTVSFDPDEGSMVLYRIGTGPLKEYSEPFELGEGVHDIEYRAVTASGKEGAPSVRRIKVDTTFPSVSALLDVPLWEGWTNGSVHLTVVTDDPDAELSYTVDGLTYPYLGPTLLFDGEYDVIPRARDQAGNVRTGSPLRVAIDTTAPRTDLVFDREFDGGRWFHDTLPAVRAVSAGDVLAPETTYYSVNGGQFRVLDGEVLGLESGLNTVRFYSRDSAGNAEEVKSRQIGLDLAPPKASVKANRTIVGGPGPVRFDMSGSTDDHNVVQYMIEFGDGTDSGWVRDMVLVHEYGSLGDYRVKVHVMDAAGRVSEKPANVRIEVLTPEEAARRLAARDGPPLWLVALSVLIFLILSISISTLIIVLVRRRGHGGGSGWEEAEDGEVEVLDWD
jgi:hypothetical protein